MSSFSAYSGFGGSMGYNRYSVFRTDELPDEVLEALRRYRGVLPYRLLPGNNISFRWGIMVGGIVDFDVIASGVTLVVLTGVCFKSGAQQVPKLIKNPGMSMQGINRVSQAQIWKLGNKGRMFVEQLEMRYCRADMDRVCGLKRDNQLTLDCKLRDGVFELNRVVSYGGSILGIGSNSQRRFVLGEILFKERVRALSAGISEQHKLLVDCIALPNGDSIIDF